MRFLEWVERIAVALLVGVCGYFAFEQRGFLVGIVAIIVGGAIMVWRETRQ